MGAGNRWDGGRGSVRGAARVQARCFRLEGEDGQDQAARPGRARAHCICQMKRFRRVPGMGGSDGWFYRGAVSGLLLLRLLGGKHPERLRRAAEFILEQLIEIRNIRVANQTRDFGHGGAA